MARKGRRIQKPYPAPPIEFEFEGQTHHVAMRDIHGTELAMFRGLKGEEEVLGLFSSISQFIQFFVYSIDGQKPEQFPIDIQAEAGRVAQDTFLAAWIGPDSGSTTEGPMSETADSPPSSTPSTD